MKLNHEEIAEEIIELRNSGDMSKNMLMVIFDHARDFTMTPSYIPLSVPFKTTERNPQFNRRIIDAIQTYFDNQEFPINVNSDDYSFTIEERDDSHLVDVEMTPKTQDGAFALDVYDMFILDQSFAQSVREFLTIRNALELDNDSLRELITRELDNVHHVMS